MVTKLFSLWSVNVNISLSPFLLQQSQHLCLVIGRQYLKWIFITRVTSDLKNYPGISPPPGRYRSVCVRIVWVPFFPVFATRRIKLCYCTCKWRVSELTCVVGVFSDSVWAYNAGVVLKYRAVPFQCWWWWLGANPQRRHFRKTVSRANLGEPDSSWLAVLLWEPQRDWPRGACPVTPDRRLAAACRDTDAHVVSQLLLLWRAREEGARCTRRQWVW